jgi:hypothetical protein
MVLRLVCPQPELKRQQRQQHRLLALLTPAKLQHPPGGASVAIM